MPFDGSAISRQTYRHGQTRGSKARRSNNSFISTGYRDSSWLIPLYSPGAMRLQVSPDPATNVDRDVLTAFLQSTVVKDTVVDRALRGSGGSTSMLRNTSVDLDSAFTSGTISFWIYQEDLGVNPGINKSSSSTNLITSYLTSEGGTSRLHMGSRIAAGTTNTVYGNTAILTQIWTHCVITSSGTAWVLYVNGEVQSLTVDSGSNTGDWFGDVASGTTVRIGGNVAESSFIEGAFDEVFTSSAIATAAQVLALYNSGRGVLAEKAIGSFPGITHYWSCSTNHTAVGYDRVGGVTLTNAGGLIDNAGIPQSTLGQDRAVEFIGDTTTAFQATVDLRAADVSGSVSVWVYFDSIGQEAIWSKHDGSSANKLELYRDSSGYIRISSTISSSQDEVRGSTVTAEATWYHIVVQTTGTTWAIYLNDATETLTVTAGSNTGEWLGDFVGTTFIVGDQQGVATSLDGRVDELGFWSTQFTAANRTFLYNTGTGRHFLDSVTIAGAVHYWSMSLHHGGIGADRLGGVTLVATDSVYDTAGIAGQNEEWANQFTFGIRNNEGFMEMKDDSGAMTFRVDDTGIRWEVGGRLVEESDGAFVWTIGGSDPDWTLQTYDTTVIFYDDSLAEVVFMNSVSIDATLGGTITFESGSYIQEPAAGGLTLRGVGSDADITIGSNTYTSAIFHDRSAANVVIMSDVTIDGTGAGRIGFATGTLLSVTDTTGAFILGTVGTDGDVTIGSNTYATAIFHDRSLANVIIMSDVTIDATGAGRIGFATGTLISVTDTTGAFVLGTVGTDGDVTIGSNTYASAIFHDRSLANVIIMSDVTIDGTGAGRVGFASGTLISVTDTTGAFIIGTVGTDGDVTIGSNTHATAIFHDRSVGNVIIMSDVTIDGTGAGRIGFASGTLISVADTTGAFTIGTVGTEGDVTIGSNTYASAIFHDRSAGSVVLMSDITFTGTSSGVITFAVGSTIAATDTTGALVITATGTDPDLTLTSGAVSHVFYDASAARLYINDQEMWFDKTNAGRIVWTNTSSLMRCSDTTGAFIIATAGTNPDIQFGDTAGVAAMFFCDASEDTVKIGILEELMRFSVGVQAGTPPAKCWISQANTTAAVPTLFLRQADVSEDFVRFQGSAAAGVLTQSIVAVADVTTATLVGYLKIFVTDDGNQITDQAYYQGIYTLA